MNTILDYSAQALEELVLSCDQPKFRVKQLIQWLYKHGVHSYDEMGNLPASFRETLNKVAPLLPPKVIDKQISLDGTRKYLLELHDGCLVETVGIPSRDKNSTGTPRRLTVCFSTQVGCPMKCSFCATGKEGFTRNLGPGEIVWQIITCQNDFGMRVSNVVAMGQGEPFLNYDNVIASLHFINSPDALGIGARHITVSTCGITKGIRRFSHEEEQFNLAISLHCAIQDTRNVLMPVCAGENLDSLKKELSHYQDVTNRRITFEYLMIRGITDTDESLVALVDYCRELQVYVNLLNVNTVEGSSYTPSTAQRCQVFIRELEKAGIEAAVRDSRGSDIAGACGQLKNSRLPL